MRLIISEVDPQAYGVIQDVAIKFGFPAVLVLLMLGGFFYVVWKFGGRITDSVIKTMDKISESNGKNSEATEKIAQLIEVMTEQNHIIDNRLSNLEHLNKKQISLMRKSIISLKDLIPQDKSHIKDLLNEILREIEEK